MWKHLTFLLATLLAFAASVVMLSGVVGVASPWMALVIMFCFLGLARVAEPLYRVKLPRSLRSIRGWELEGVIYRSLAVPAFGRFLANTPLRFLNSSLYLSSTRRAALALRLQVESAEAIHFWAAILLLPYMAFCLMKGQRAAFAWLALLQLLINVYPVMHLRFVRARLDGAIGRSAGRGKIRRHE